MAASVFEAAGVRKSYGIGTETEIEILHGIDLVLGAAEIVALTGPSGAGKSTFLNVMGRSSGRPPGASGSTGRTPVTSTRRA